MRGSVPFSFALLVLVCRSGPAQDVVSASAGVLQYFEGGVIIDDKPVEHKAAVFPSLKNGSIVRTVKGRAELLLTPGVYLRMDENTSLRMQSNSLTDTRLEVMDGSAILDNLNATAGHPVALIFRDSTVRFPKPGVYRIDGELGELEAYSGEAEVSHEEIVPQRRVSSTVDSSHLYFFALGLTTNKFGDGAMDEFYDWAHNRSDIIADHNQIASAEQEEAQDADPGGGIFAAPPLAPPSYSDPSTWPVGPSLYSSVADPFYYSNPSIPFLGFQPYLGIIILAPPHHRPGTKWPTGPAAELHPRPVTTRWRTSPVGSPSYVPGSTLHFPAGSTYRAPIYRPPPYHPPTYHPGAITTPRPPVTSAPRVAAPPIAAHPVAPHVGGIGHR